MTENRELPDNDLIKSKKSSFVILVDEIIVKEKIRSDNELERQRTSTAEYKLSLIEDELLRFKGTRLGLCRINQAIKSHFDIHISDDKLKDFLTKKLGFSTFLGVWNYK